MIGAHWGMLCRLRLGHTARPAKGHLGTRIGLCVHTAWPSSTGPVGGGQRWVGRGSWGSWGSRRGDFCCPRWQGQCALQTTRLPRVPILTHVGSLGAVTCPTPVVVIVPSACGKGNLCKGNIQIPAERATGPWIRACSRLPIPAAATSTTPTTSLATAAPSAFLALAMASTTPTTRPATAAPSALLAWATASTTPTTRPVTAAPSALLAWATASTTPTTRPATAAPSALATASTTPTSGRAIPTPLALVRGRGLRLVRRLRCPADAPSLGLGTGARRGRMCGSGPRGGDEGRFWLQAQIQRGGFEGPVGG